MRATKNRTGVLAGLWIDQWLALAAVNLDALNLGEMDQALLDADHHRAACNRFAPARFQVSEHDRALRAKRPGARGWHRAFRDRAIARGHDDDG